MIKKGEPIEKYYKLEETVGEYTTQQRIIRSRQKVHQQKNRTTLRLQMHLQKVNERGRGTVTQKRNRYPHLGRSPQRRQNI